MVLSNSVRTASIASGASEVTTMSGSLEERMPAFRSAAITYCRNRRGSSSAGSSESHATRRPLACAQSARSVDFPEPAGAAVRVTVPPATESSRSRRRPRLTRFCRGDGTKSFVASRGASAGVTAMRTF
jgi:hypothetical protein